MVTLKEAPVYLLAGTEQFLKEEYLGKIKSTFLDRESGDFNFNVFYPARRKSEYPGTTLLEKILECAQTLPFIGSKRVILVRQIEQFSASDKGLLLTYLKTPQRFTCLVLETEETNLYQNFFTEISKNAQVIFCQPLKGNALFSWIKNQARMRGKKIENNAIQLLVNNLGHNLGLLSNALENLRLYRDKKETIEVGDVEKMVGPDLETSAFELFSAIMLHEKAKALQILDSLLKDAVNSSQILGALAHQLLSGKERIAPFLAERCFLELQNTDRDIKTGRLGERLALELLVTRSLSLF